MTSEVRFYLKNLKKSLHLSPRKEKEILQEIQGHVEDRALELQEQGMSKDASMEEALRGLGSPSIIAEGMYNTHSRTSLGDAALASLPHILTALYFSLHLWSSLVWIALGYAVILAIAIGAWRSGRPVWAYPWVGYSMAAPVAIWFFAFMALITGAWSLMTEGTLPLHPLAYLGILAYIPLALSIMSAVLVRVVRTDWIFASLMGLPFPFIATWLVFLQGRGGILAYQTEHFQKTDGYTSIGLVALAVTTAAFCRMRQRLPKLSLLLIAIPVVFALVYLSYRSEAGPLGLVGMSTICVGFLLSPYLLESRISSDDEWLDSPDAERSSSGAG